MYLTGCGAKALYWFTCFPGSSSFALEASNLYAKGSLESLLNEKVDKYVTSETAMAMA